MERLRLNEEGFTLIEIMIVLAIIGFILGMVGYNLMGRFEKAKVETAQNQIRLLQGAMSSYKRDNNRYPTTDQGLEALVSKPSIGRTPKFYPKGGYLSSSKVPSDPWDNPYRFASPGIHGHDIEISSDGPDGDQGTEDDLKSWELVE